VKVEHPERRQSRDLPFVCDVRPLVRCVSALRPNCESPAMLFWLVACQWAYVKPHTQSVYLFADVHITHHLPVYSRPDIGKGHERQSLVQLRSTASAINAVATDSLSLRNTAEVAKI